MLHRLCYLKLRTCFCRLAGICFLDTKKTDRDAFSKDIGDKDFRKYYFGIDAQRSRFHSKILRRAWPKGEKVLLRFQIDAYK